MASNDTTQSGKRKFGSCEKQPCKYGNNCFRKNPQHFYEFSHPTDTSSAKRLRLEDARRLSENRGIYLTAVQGIDDRYNDKNIALNIEDILSDGADFLLESVQFNYCIDLSWLIGNYPKSARNLPLTVVHGLSGKDETDLQAEAMSYSHVNLIKAKLPIPYGTHHSKMMLLFYTNGVRVIIHTANLIQQDWFQKTQGLWRSPLFPKKLIAHNKKDDRFKIDLLEYLQAYQSTKLNAYIAKLEEYDMINANAHIVASIPGRHKVDDIRKWGHPKLGKILRESSPSCDVVTADWPIIAQFSSIGSLGAESSNWLTSEFLDSLSACKHGNQPGTNLKLIYPSIENVRNSLEGYSAGGSLPFSVQTAMKQRYIKEYLCQWKSDALGRSLASPHIKCYTRISEDSCLGAWFLLTSANLSKAAWGVYEKKQSQLMIRSYEIGVLLTPIQKRGNEENLFSLKEDNFKEYLKLPFDVPLTPYSSSDKPWVWDIRYTKEDSHGRLWIPR